MNITSSIANVRPACPDCANPHVVIIGPLPAVAFFAGRALEDPLPCAFLYRCPNCSLKFRSPPPSESLERAYDNASTESWSHDAKDRTEWEWILSSVARLPGGPLRILDVGCYTGGLLRQLAGRAILAGVEPNQRARELTTHATGAQVWPSLDAIPPDARFDVVIATDVIEHVVRPSVFLETCFARLVAGGTVFLTTGDGNAPLARLFGANWWYWYYPEHTSFISEKWIRWFCETHRVSDLELRRFRYHNLSLLTRGTHLLHTLAYGLAGRAYLGTIRRLYRLLGRTWGVFPKGAGVSADHLFIAIKL